MKYGFDIHGVLDTYPAYCEMTRALRAAGHEVWIVTGLKYDGESIRLLKELGADYDHYFSIVDYLEGAGVPVEWRDGLPYADKVRWDIAKAEFCQRQAIDVLFDDSPRYKEVFEELGIDTLYCHVHNTKRIQYQTRG